MTAAALLWGPRRTNLFSFVVEPALQLELFQRHIIQAVGISFTPFGLAFGAGAGYAYEWEIVPRVLRLELGGVVGGFVVGQGEPGSCFDEHMFYVMLRPTLHLGYKHVFFSMGPRMLLGDGVVAGGVSAGLLFRI